MPVLPKAIYSFSAIPVKILTDFSVEMEKLILKYVTKGKGFQVVKTILKKRGKVGEFTLPYFKTDSKTSLIKIVWYWHEERPMSIE